jgi:hypothetical protein
MNPSSHPFTALYRKRHPPDVSSNLRRCLGRCCCVGRDALPQWGALGASKHSVCDHNAMKHFVATLSARSKVINDRCYAAAG